MGILRCFHLHTLTPLLGSQPSSTRTLKVYITGWQKWSHSGQKARRSVEGISCGLFLVFLHFQGHAEDPCILDPEVTSRRFLGFILRTCWMLVSVPTKASCMMMKFFVIRWRAFCGCTFFLHRCESGDAKAVITKEAGRMRICRRKNIYISD